jgi:prephenate dehydrogenase
MGGSLGLALRAQSPSTAVAGYDADAAAAREALAHGAVTELADAPERIHAAAEVVALAVPPRAAAALIGASGPLGTALPPGALMMDLSSVMLPPLAAAMEPRSAPIADRYVPAHPLAGSESSGIGAARADLFAGAAVLVGRPLDAGSPGARIAALWSALGANPSAIAPPLHDALVALTSHLPYAASVALVRTLRRTGSMTRALAETAGPGLRDTTRVAASPSELWAEILSLNGPKLIPALELLEREVRALRHAIAEGGPALRTHLEEARAFREELSA